jgi:hypothetical protein
MSDIPALGSSLAFWDWAGYVSTGLVFIGVVGESIIELTDWVKLPERKKRAGKASALILILGLAGELISTVKISGVTGELIATLNKEAGDAREAAGNAQTENLRLQGELTSATEESRSNDAALAREQQKTAKAQEDAAQAQLALRKYLDEVAKHQRGRLLDFKKFVAALKGKPKASVRLLYSPNDSEAYTFAGQILRWLGPGAEGDGAGWDVSSPMPIPTEGGDTHPELANAPPAMKYGAWYGLAILTSEPIAGHNPPWDDKTPMGVLRMALMENGFPPISHFGVTSVPKDTLVIVVGQKP